MYISYNIPKAFNFLYTVHQYIDLNPKVKTVEQTS